MSARFQTTGPNDQNPESPWSLVFCSIAPLLLYLAFPLILLNVFLPVSQERTTRGEQGQSYFRINQVGYPPDSVKVALAFSQQRLAESFQLVQVETGKVAFQGKVRSPGSQAWGSFPRHVELDFSKVQVAGKYFLRMEPAESAAFSIDSESYSRLPDQLLEFMRQQRCGYNPFLDAVCHPFDGRTAYGPMVDGTYIDARGGWHDAGDMLKYLMTSSNATAQMLLAYRLSPKIFADKFNDKGHSGPNGVPDVLDEALWGLEWMLRLHPESDQLFHQVADDRDHSGWRLPQDDASDYSWGKGSYRVVYFANGRPQGLNRYQSEATGVANLAGRYAAAMAMAYQIWKDDERHRLFAERCLSAGIEVYQLGKAHEGFQQGNSYGAPYRYNEDTWADDMEWGAAELFRATHEARYLADGKRYADLIGATSWMGRDTAAHYQFYPFMNLGHYALYDLVDRKTRKILSSYYQEGIEQSLRRGQSNPYSVGVPFLWCSNNLTVALATQCLLYERMTGDHRYSAFAAAQRDWLFGRNPWGTSMFTGIPESGVFPNDPHLITTHLTQRPVRGGLVDGPVTESIFRSLKGVTLSKPDLFSPFQSEKAVYHDDLQDYSTNEPTMDGTASAVLLMALCAVEG